MISRSGYFGVNTESSCLDLKFTKYLTADSAEISSCEVQTSIGRVNATADIFIFGCRDQVDPEWAGRVTSS